MNYEGVVMVRIDDRLIHGQVMTSWLNFLQANKIMVVDDGAAQDPLIKNILKSCIPGNIKLVVWPKEKAAARLVKGFAGDKCIILVKYPQTLYDLYKDHGILFDHINIGGMGVSGDRKQFFRNISASDDEKRMLRELIDAGSKIEVRIIAEDSPTDISSMV